MNIGTAALLGACIVAAGFLMGGRYQGVSGPRGGDQAPIVYIVDRFTGNVSFCGGMVCRPSSWTSNP
jgi:hypothetical protein